MLLIVLLIECWDTEHCSYPPESVRNSSPALLVAPGVSLSSFSYPRPRPTSSSLLPIFSQTSAPLLYSSSLHTTTFTFILSDPLSLSLSLSLSLCASLCASAFSPSAPSCSFIFLQVWVCGWCVGGGCWQGLLGRIVCVWVFGIMLRHTAVSRSCLLDPVDTHTHTHTHTHTSSCRVSQTKSVRLICRLLAWLLSHKIVNFCLIYCKHLSLFHSVLPCYLTLSQHLHTWTLKPLLILQNTHSRTHTH